MSRAQPYDVPVAEALRQLRLRLAMNLFKREILRSSYLPGKSQADQLMNALASAGVELGVSRDSLISWLQPVPVSPKQGKIAVLDRWARQAIRFTRPADDARLAPPEKFFSSLVRGGLVEAMFEPTKSKHVRTLLLGRADSYRSLSAWHLHVDAIEVGALSSGYRGVSLREVTSMAASSVLRQLSLLWGPRSGAIFPLLSSPQRRRWLAASESERRAMEDAYKTFKPRPIFSEMAGGDRPAWDVCGIKADAPWAQIQKTLFAIAADKEFLQADHLAAWSMDLATAAIASHALAWSDRERTFGGRFVSDERLFWRALDAALFGSLPLREIAPSLLAAMGRCDVQPSRGWLVGLLRGRRAYQCEIGSLGLQVDDVRRLALQCAQANPLQEVG